jgi:hypothetical protein
MHRPDLTGTPSRPWVSTSVRWYSECMCLGPAPRQLPKCDKVCVRERGTYPRRVAAGEHVIGLAGAVHAALLAHIIHSPFDGQVQGPFPVAAFIVRQLGGREDARARRGQRHGASPKHTGGQAGSAARTRFAPTLCHGIVSTHRGPRACERKGAWHAYLPHPPHARGHHDHHGRRRCDDPR